MQHESSNLFEPGTTMVETKSGIPRKKKEKKKPNLGFFKLNVDTSFYVDSGMGSTAVIIRNVHGTFVAESVPFINSQLMQQQWKPYL